MSRAEARKIDAAAAAKADKTEVRKAATQGALPIPKKRDIIAAMDLRKQWNAKFEKVKAQRREALKHLKSQHISQKLVDWLINLEKSGAAEFRAEMDSFAAGLSAVGAPFQMHVFDTLYSDDIAQAKAEGAAAGKSGKPPECRYAEETPAHEAYIEAYMVEQAKLAPGADKLSEEDIRAAVKGSEHYEGATAH